MGEVVCIDLAQSKTKTTKSKRPTLCWVQNTMNRNLDSSGRRIDVVFTSTTEGSE